MKNADEIRAYKDDLELLYAQPCSCKPGTQHGMRCMIGGQMMKSHIEMLGWVLGEANGHEEFIAKMRAGAALIREGK